MLVAVGLTVLDVRLLLDATGEAGHCTGIEDDEVAEDDVLVDSLVDVELWLEDGGEEEPGESVETPTQ